MRRVALAFGGLIWCVVVFAATFWLTFPSDTLANRVEHQVPLLLGSEWSADVGGVSPWWVGAGVHDMKLYRETRGEDGEPVAELAAIVDSARARVGLFSILRRSPYVTGSVTLTEGTVDWELGTAMEGNGNGVQLADLVLRSDAFPVADLFALAGAGAPTVTGTVGVNVDVHAGEDGLRDATGSIAIDGSNLVVSDLELPEVGPLGMEFPISTLAVHAQVEKGKATIQDGRIVSELFTVEVKGDATLRDPLTRSSVDIELVLSNLGPQLAMFESFLATAKEGDGTWRLTCKGILSRGLASLCSPGRSSTTSRRSSRPSRGESLPTPAGGVSSPGGDEADEGDDERARRRAEIQERLRKKREEREARQRGETPPPPEPPETLPPEDEEEPLDELPPEDPDLVEEPMHPEDEELE